MEGEIQNVWDRLKPRAALTNSDGHLSLFVLPHPILFFVTLLFCLSHRRRVRQETPVTNLMGRVSM